MKDRIMTLLNFSVMDYAGFMPLNHLPNKKSVTTNQDHVAVQL